MPSIETVIPATIGNKIAPNTSVNHKSDHVKANELKELELAGQMGAPDVYIDSESETSWYHWTESIWVKPYRFNNRNGTYVIALKTDPEAQLGKHRHRGEVKAYTVRGSWGYHE